MRITLVVMNLDRGGTERAVCTLAGCLSERGLHVTLLSFSRNTRAYDLHPSVAVRHLDLEAVSRNPVQGLLRSLRRIRVLRRAIRDSRADIVISFIGQPNVLTLLATRGLHTPVVVSERTVAFRRDMPGIWGVLRRLTYPLADALVCPTSAGLAEFQEMIAVRGAAIPNAVRISGPRPDQGTARPSGHVLIAMGRLIAPKGFDLLLQAFAGIADRHADWSLTIIGEGPLRSQLEEQTKSLKLTGRVRFAGQHPDPFRLLRAAHLFV